MPNHVHALIAFRNTGQSINTIVGNGKRFIAYEIINRLKELKEEKLLHQLHLSVEAKDLVDSAPKNIKEGISKAEADEIVAKLKEAGADVEIA